MHTLARKRIPRLPSIIALLLAALLMAGCTQATHAPTSATKPVPETGGVEEARKVIEENGTGLFMYTLKDSDDYEVFRNEPQGDPIDVEPDT